MQKKKIMAWFLGIPVLVVILVIIILLNEPERDGISRAMAYKAAALSLTTADTCREQENTEASLFPEGDRSQWYVKYMDYLYRQELISPELTPPDGKTAEGWLTYEEADYLAKQISGRLAGQVKVSKRNKNSHYPKDQWWILYQEILKITDTEGQVKTKDLQVYGTPLNVENTAAWVAYTNEGTLGFEGLSLDSYIDKEIRVLIRDNEMIHIDSLVSDDVTYRNVWVLSADESMVNGFVGSVSRSFQVKKNLKNPEEMVSCLADLYLEDGKLKKVVLKKDKISGKVLEVNDDSIEIEGYGEVPLDQNFNVYKLYGEFRKQRMSDILVGYDAQEFVVADGKLCAALTLREFEADTIRVLVMSTGFHSIFHDEIQLSLKSSAKVIYDNDKEAAYNAGDTITISMNDKKLDGGRIIIQPSDETKGIGVTTIERAQGTPVYPGRLEIKREGDGLVLVNELYMEDYLKRVVPSEMPASYEKEALKAQAVCARTYAYRQIRGNSYMQYGAHVDDSTSFQVYNNIETNANTDTAVNETYGMLLMYQGAPLEAYYFSTSCGHTTDGTIWGADLSSVPYLKGVAVKAGGGVMDLTSNVNFSDFIKNASYPSYESSFALYRWHLSLTSTQLAQKVSDIGTITKVTMKERGTGGIGRVMEIEGTEGKKTITGQGQIRSVLGHTEAVIIKNDGSTLTGWDTIPSAFITVERSEPDENQVTTFTIYGGGYGHGVGMSQNGAQGMAKAGLHYKEILTAFFDGAEIKES